jgi:hypothetical protein
MPSSRPPLATAAGLGGADDDRALVVAEDDLAGAVDEVIDEPDRRHDVAGEENAANKDAAQPPRSPALFNERHSHPGRRAIRGS